MSNEHLAAAARGDLVKVVVLVRAVGAALKEPPVTLAEDADAPAVAVLTRQKRKAAGSLLQTETEMGYLARDSSQ